jgi:hypothetical protein
MTPHAWAIENVDGGPVGDADFFQCTVCGCAGGCADFEGAVPHPFLPGPAQVVSTDCAIAHEQISYFVLGVLRVWGYDLSSVMVSRRQGRGRFGNLHGEPEPEEDPVAVARSEKYALLSKANFWTPRSVQRVEFHSLVMDARCSVRVLSVDDVREKLITLGFKVEADPCATCGKPNDRSSEDPAKDCFNCIYIAGGGKILGINWFPNSGTT